jgi:hypothetical protein
MALKCLKSGLFGSIAALLALYSVGLIYEGFVNTRYSGALTYPWVDKPAAERADAQLTQDAPPPVRAAAVERLIEADPANPESWTAVAYADYLAHGRLTPRGVQALDHSYAVSFFDQFGAVWRVGFALDNWGALYPDLRKNVLAEAQAVLDHRDDPELGLELRRRLADVRGPDGRLAAFLLTTPIPTPPAGPGSPGPGPRR